MSKVMDYGIHWFRRDLRIAGNPALQENWKLHQGRVLGFFCFDPVFLERSDFSIRRFDFFLKTLKALQDELRGQGGDLWVLDHGPEKAFLSLLKTLEEHQQPVPAMFTWNRDYEPFARQRDQKMQRLLEEASIPYLNCADHLVVEPDEILSPSTGGPYKVYSPFAKQWRQVLAKRYRQDRIAQQRRSFTYLQRSAQPQGGALFHLRWSDLLSQEALSADCLDSYAERMSRQLVDDGIQQDDIPEAGSFAAWRSLQDFKDKLGDYAQGRDIPAIQATSRLSVYLKNGSLTSAQIIAFLGLDPLALAKDSGADRFLAELIWREFYYHILYHFPRVEKEAFLTHFDNIEWSQDQQAFERWQQGRTGFPIVDAGMRQLRSSGWMHNRVRMIVASFLTKDLLINWQWGERYFMNELLDGDLAPNNGGWQWAASTGCDPQPYFRIFNPWLQSAKFDPQGDYIRRYVPELKDVPAKALHRAEADRGPDYLRPMVDHGVQRKLALQMYEEAKAAANTSPLT